MINDYTIVIFNGKITTLDGFIEHCMQVEDDDRAQRPNIPEPDRESLIKKAERLKKRTELHIADIRDFGDGSPYSERVNGQREVGLNYQRKIREKRIELIGQLLLENEERAAESSRYANSEAYELVKQQLTPALVLASRPIEDLEELSEDQAKAFLLRRLQDEVDAADRVITALKTAPEIELAAALGQWEIDEAQIRPFDISDTGFSLEAMTLQ